MKMIVAVVRDELATSLTDQLSRAGMGATKLASTGGFLKAGSSTFLVGVPPDQVDQALGVVKAVCKGKGGTQSGATVFVLDVESMTKM